MPLTNVDTSFDATTATLFCRNPWRMPCPGRSVSRQCTTVVCTARRITEAMMPHTRKPSSATGSACDAVHLAV